MGDNWELLLGPLRAVAIVIGHFVVLAVLVFGFWCMDELITALWGQDEPMVWGRMPLKYLFQGVDVALILLLTYSAGRTILWELERYRRK